MEDEGRLVRSADPMPSATRMRVVAGVLTVGLCIACDVAPEESRARSGQDDAPPRPTAVCAPGESELTDALRLVDGMLADRRKDDRIPGLAAGVVCADSLIFAEGYGIMAVDDSTPVTPETRFRIASVTKLFTATGVVMLDEADVLSLEDPIRRHLAWFEVRRPPETGESPITVRQLVTHTSGLPTDSRRADFSRLYRPGRAEAIAALPEEELQSKPGAAYAYSNLGYGLLGEIIAEASGSTYADFVRREILAPLDMNGTLVHPSRTDRTAWGHGPLRKDGSRERAGFWDLGFVTPAGGVASSVADLGRFMRFQLAPYVTRAPRLVSAAALRDMHRVQFEMDPSRGGSGLGWGVETSESQHVVYHGGELPEQTSFLLLDVEARIGVVVLANAQDVDASGLAQDVLRIIRRAVAGPDAAVPHPAIPPAPP